MDILSIRKRAKEKNVANVEPILGTITDPKLPAGGVDLILMVDVYHELDHPYEMTQAMVKGLKVGGRLVLVEYRMEDPRVPIKLVHKMTQATATLYGLGDRGVLAPGFVGDANLIDHASLQLRRPELVAGVIAPSRGPRFALLGAAAVESVAFVRVAAVWVQALRSP